MKVQEGQEVGSLIITVKHGKLDVETAESRLPKGIYICDPHDSHGGTEYALIGPPEAGELGDHEVQLVAVRGSNRSEPKRVTITVAEKPMEWQLPNPPKFNLVKGQMLTGYSRLVTGAVSLIPTWSPSSQGLEVKPDQSNPKSWSLSGIPSQADVFNLSLEAKSKGGKVESKTVTILVKEAPYLAASAETLPAAAPYLGDGKVRSPYDGTTITLAGKELAKGGASKTPADDG